MMYAYSKGNRLEQPVTYMYSRFDGASFLDAYFEDRRHAVGTLLRTADGTAMGPGRGRAAIMAACAKLSDSPTFGSRVCDQNANFWAAFGRDPSNRMVASADDELASPSAGQAAVPNGKTIDTESFLTAMLLPAAGSPGNSNDTSEFDFLVRRFEISKRIFPRYRHGFRNGSGDHSDILGYVLFALALCLAYRRSSSLRHLNALLKSCDILSSVRDLARSDSITALGAALALVAEVDFIASLAGAKGVCLAS